ncbi:lysophospholipid acyltransferase family protein [uncultured Fibrobacter sp.]|uniref:lysophospholipid acyltransferase family protein n=1 Tax=uncultured Fibrobacter sp. TaxID=261512 RepID=UPI0025E55737|nr:lysophospholipid acyltransferase family protein [uncultured Fibrobacter sp.]
MLRRIKYIRRLLSKLSSFAVFGISSLILGTSLFPLFHVLAGFSEKRFNIISRRFVNLFFRFFVKYIEVTGAMRLSVENRELLKGIKGKVVIANHPSLLDVVILFSLIPNSNCIVKGALVQNACISAIIRNLYIPNSIPFEEQLERAKKSMIEDGNNLIIFPEGTRSRPGEPWQFKKGAARFALFAEADVVPIYFGGNEKIGLRKHDKMLQFHPTERYMYNLKVLPSIPVSPYKDMPMSKSAILLTDKMKEVLEKGHQNEKVTQ